MEGRITDAIEAPWGRPRYSCATFQCTGDDIGPAASTAFLIENPDKTSDLGAMNLAAVESVLKTYNAILQQKPEAKSKTLDDLLKKQSQGKLKDSIQKQCH